MDKLTNTELNQLESAIATACQHPLDRPFQEKMWKLIAEERARRKRL